MDCSRTIRKFRKQFFGMIFKTITMSCHISMATVHPITAYSFLIYRFCRSSFYEVKKLHILYSYAYTLICSPAVFVYDKTSIVNLRSIFASISRVQTPSYNVQHPSASTPAAQFISFPRYLLKIINNNTTPFSITRLHTFIRKIIAYHIYFSFYQKNIFIKICKKKKYKML